MKKITRLILKIPIFIVRWLNASVMRIPAVYGFSLLGFSLFSVFILDSTSGLGGEMIPVHICLTLILAVFWGLLYTILKLPVNKKIYKSMFSKILAVLGRVIYAGYLLNLVNSRTSEFVSTLLIFISLELVVNAVVVAIKGKTAKQIIKKAQQAIGGTQQESIPAPAPSQTVSAPQQSAPEAEKSTPVAPVASEKSDKQAELDSNFNFLVDNFVNGQGMLKFVDGHQQILKNKAGKEFIVPNFIVNNQAAFIVDRLDLLGIQVKQQKDGTYLASHKGKVYTFNKIMTVKNAVTQFIKNEFSEEFDIVYILCLSDDKAIVKVNKNSELPILRLSEFGPFIENYKSSRPMSDELKNKVASLVAEPEETEAE